MVVSTDSLSSGDTAVASQQELAQTDQKEVSIEANEKGAERGQHEPSGPVEDASAWMRVLAAFLVFFMTWGPSTGIGAFESFYQTSLLATYSPSEIAWIGGTQTFLLVAGGAVSGPLFDLGYFRLMTIVGLSLCVVAFMLLSLSTQYYQIFLTQGIVLGLGTGLAYVPSLAMVSVRFERHRAIAVGLVTSGSSVGGLIFPILIRRLEPRVGFAWTARLIGFLLLVITLVVLLILSRDHQPKKPPRKIIQRSALTESPFVLFSLGYFLQILAFWIPLAYVTSYALNRLHLSEDLSFYLLAIVNGASFFGRVLPCLVTQRFGAFNVLMVATGACTIVLFAWIRCVDLGSFVAFCVLWGFFSGVIPSVVPLCVVAKPLSPSMEVTGTRLGMAWLACSFGTLIGNPIVGALLDASGGSYVGAQAFAGAAMAGAGLAYIWPWICHERVRRDENAQRAAGH